MSSVEGLPKAHWGTDFKNLVAVSPLALRQPSRLSSVSKAS